VDYENRGEYEGGQNWIKGLKCEKKNTANQGGGVGRGALGTKKKEEHGCTQHLRAKKGGGGCLGHQERQLVETLWVGNGVTGLWG